MSCCTCGTEDIICRVCEEARRFDLHDCTDRGGTNPQPFPITCTPPAVDISESPAVLSYIDGEPVWVIDSQ